MGQWSRDREHTKHTFHDQYSTHTHITLLQASNIVGVPSMGGRPDDPAMRQKLQKGAMSY